MAFISTVPVRMRPCSKSSILPARSFALLPRPGPPTFSRPTIIRATARPLRASSLAAVVPVLASPQQLRSRLGPPSALLDRVFLSLLLLLLLYLFPIFPTPFASLLRVLFLAGPLAVPWIRATRANAALRRQGVFILLSGPFRATKVGPRDMEVELRCEDSELFVVKRVRLRETVLQGITHAHALCVRKGDSIVALEIVVRGKLLVGADGVREKVLRELCGAASRLDV